MKKKLISLCGILLIALLYTILTQSLQFDLQTFVVVLAFLLYIVLFMEFLYKLFKR